MIDSWSNSTIYSFADFWVLAFSFIYYALLVSSQVCFDQILFIWGWVNAWGINLSNSVLWRRMSPHSVWNVPPFGRTDVYVYTDTSQPVVASKATNQQLVILKVLGFTQIQGWPGIYRSGTGYTIYCAIGVYFEIFAWFRDFFFSHSFRESVIGGKSDWFPDNLHWVHMKPASSWVSDHSLLQLTMKTRVEFAGIGKNTKKWKKKTPKHELVLTKSVT